MSRIMLIHALEESIAPIRRSFARLWPEAKSFDLLDSSLAPDLAHDGRLTDQMKKRFATLGRYAEETDGAAGTTDAILFTCSAFGPAIEEVKKTASIPVLRPNEAAFEDALLKGEKIGLLVTFEPSLAALSAELHEMAEALGRRIEVSGRVAEGALAALKAGDAGKHDALAAQAAGTLRDADVIVLGQFSLARAAEAVSKTSAAPVVTTPDSAVLKLRQLVAPA